MESIRTSSSQPSLRKTMWDRCSVLRLFLGGLEIFAIFYVFSIVLLLSFGGFYEDLILRIWKVVFREPTHSRNLILARKLIFSKIYSNKVPNIRHDVDFILPVTKHLREKQIEHFPFVGLVQSPGLAFYIRPGQGESLIDYFVFMIFSSPIFFGIQGFNSYLIFSYL